MIPAFLVQDSAEASKGFFQQVVDAFSPDLFMSWEFWTVTTAVLLVGEVLTAGFLLLAFVPGTAAAAVMAAVGWGMQAQLWGFIGGTVIGLVILRPIFVRRASAGGLPSNVGALVGQQAQVTEPIRADAPGRVRIRGEEWRATADTSIDSGACVCVISVEGNAVHVTPQA